MTYLPPLDSRHCEPLHPASNGKYVLADPASPRTGKQEPDGSLDGGYHCCRRSDGRLLVFGNFAVARRAADKRGARVRVQSEDGYALFGDDGA